MRKFILTWLFGTDDIEYYVELLGKRINHNKECIELIHAHEDTLKREEWAHNTIRKLIRICENHGIDIDEEIRHIQFEDEPQKEV